MTTGERIYKLRKQKKMSQAALGEKAGVSDTYIGKLEKNNGNATTKVLENIANALDTTVNFLLYGENTQSISQEIFPEKFVVSEEARNYVKKHQIFASEGFDVEKLTDDEILDFANALLDQMKLVSYKYKK